MNALDDLRRSVFDAFVAEEANSSVSAEDMIAHAIDAFEAAHPGLIDHTGHCMSCERPLDLARIGPEYCNRGRTYCGYGGCGGDAIDVVREDGRTFGPAKYLCPACAKEGT